MLALLRDWASSELASSTRGGGRLELWEGSRDNRACSTGRLMLWSSMSYGDEEMECQHCTDWSGRSKTPSRELGKTTRCQGKERLRPRQTILEPKRRRDSTWTGPIDPLKLAAGHCLPRRNEVSSSRRHPSASSSAFPPLYDVLCNSKMQGAAKVQNRSRGPVLARTNPPPWS